MQPLACTASSGEGPEFTSIPRNCISQGINSQCANNQTIKCSCKARSNALLQDRSRLSSTETLREKKWFILRESYLLGLPQTSAAASLSLASGRAGAGGSLSCHPRGNDVWRGVGERGICENSDELLHVFQKSAQCYIP